MAFDEKFAIDAFGFMQRHIHGRLHDFCVELNRDQGVSDFTWDAVFGRFGAQATVDLVAVNGYYTLLAMLMNAARTAVPPQRPG